MNECSKKTITVFSEADKEMADLQLMLIDSRPFYSGPELCFQISCEITQRIYLCVKLLRMAFSSVPCHLLKFPNILSHSVGQLFTFYGTTLTLYHEMQKHLILFLDSSRFLIKKIATLIQI